jgi:hypothetical protein
MVAHCDVNIPAFVERVNVKLMTVNVAMPPYLAYLDGTNEGCDLYSPI